VITSILRARGTTRIGGEDAVDVGVDLADVGFEGCGERHGGGVGSAAAESRDVARDPVEALEARDDRDSALVEGLAHALRRHVDDLRGAVLGGGQHAGLAAGERERLEPHALDRHREQGHRDALAGGEQHVELSGGRDRGDLGGEIQQLVGGVAHRADGDDDVVAGTASVDDALGHALDALGVCDRGTAELLHDQCHRSASC
jgi:hypothetical protein